MLITRSLGAALLILVISASASAEENGGPQVGQPSPNIAGRTLVGDNPYRLNRDKGMPKVINFFWVHCHACKEEMPELAKLEKEFPEIKFISVHSQFAGNPKETKESVDKFVKSLAGAPSNVVLTWGGMEKDFSYPVLPHTVVLDSDNVVLMNLIGFTPEGMASLKELLHKVSR